MSRALDWNPIAAAGAQSAFAAVLAGFVFIGVVYVLTDEHRRHHGATLVLFMAAFVCLGAGSYVGTLVAGEKPKLRAWSESMFLSGLVAVGAVAMLAALLWLVPYWYGEDVLVRRFSLACVLFLAVVVSELMTTAGRGYLLDVGWGDRRNQLYWYLGAQFVLIVAATVGRHFPDAVRTKLVSAFSVSLWGSLLRQSSCLRWVVS
jgi:hypothetical protein